MRTRTDAKGKEEWLLLHKRDEDAVEGWDAEAHPLSVLSGRTNDEVAAEPRKLWRSDLPADRAEIPAPPKTAGPALAVTAGPAQAKAARKPAKKAAGIKAATEDELGELDRFRRGGTWEIFGRSLRVTNLDKPLFPGLDGDPPITKREFLRYTAAVAPTVVPYLEGRPVNLHRYPDGVDSPGFWQKELPDHAPDWVPRWVNPAASAGETRTYLMVDEPAALVWAANFGAVEWHPWTSKGQEPDRPTYALIDLDPGQSTEWDDLRELACVHRAAFEHLGVVACAKVTGRRGIQIWVPIATGPTFDETRAWVKELSRTVGAVMPGLVSWKWQKSNRAGLARLDYTQNAINRTLVAPYSPRPAAGAPVSAPIAWDELDDPELRPDGFTIRDILPRLAERGDLFHEVLENPQTLPLLT